jgi:hypothetical protein
VGLSLRLFTKFELLAGGPGGSRGDPKRFSPAEKEAIAMCQRLVRYPFFRMGADGVQDDTQVMHQLLFCTEFLMDRNIGAITAGANGMAQQSPLCSLLAHLVGDSSHRTPTLRPCWKSASSCSRPSSAVVAFVSVLLCFFPSPTIQARSHLGWLLAAFEVYTALERSQPAAGEHLHLGSQSVTSRCFATSDVTDLPLMSPICATQLGTGALLPNRRPLSSRLRM